MSVELKLRVSMSFPIEVWADDDQTLKREDIVENVLDYLSQLGKEDIAASIDSVYLDGVEPCLADDVVGNWSLFREPV